MMTRIILISSVLMMWSCGNDKTESTGNGQFQVIEYGETEVDNSADATADKDVCNLKETDLQTPIANEETFCK